MTTVLAGDVGGTKTALALFEADAAGLRLLRETQLASHAYPSLESALARFLAEPPAPRIDAVCVGVAGPVVDGRGVATNLPWAIEERALAAAAAAPRARLLNDLEATAHGVIGLPPAARHRLQEGVARPGAIAVIAAGTGLGEAIVVPSATGRPHVIATEGGHVDFAPRDELEDGLARWLRARFGHVSYERVLSGPGLVNVYRYLAEARTDPESPAVAARLAAEDAAAVITELGLAGKDALCSRALDVFVGVYGAEAANLALKCLALGGVVVAGGIAPRIVARLARGGFLRAFRAKGRLSPLLASIPVDVALDVRAPLLGAATVALSLV